MLVYCFLGDDGSFQPVSDDLVARDLPELAKLPHASVMVGGGKAPSLSHPAGPVVLVWTPGDGSQTHVPKLPPPPCTGEGDDEAIRAHGCLANMAEYQAWMDDMESYLESRYA